MNVRRATSGDEAVLKDLWQAFVSELPEPDGFAPETWDVAWPALEADIEGAGVYLAEADGETVGMLDASAAPGGRWHVERVYVRETARRGGVATELLRAFAADARSAGAGYVSLEVLTTNHPARTAWERLGFSEVEVTLGQSLEALETRLGTAPAGPSHGAVHAQTDDHTSVEHAVAQVIPRLTAPALTGEGRGWIRIADPGLDADPDAMAALAQEISDRLGTVSLALGVEHGSVVRYRLYEHGRMVDEYLSVPTFYGDLAKVDELGLAANPTLVSRLTGAPFADVRRIAATAASPAELAPAEQLYVGIAQMMGVEP